MTYARWGILGTKQGHRDELVTHLTQRSPRLTELGCLLYEVGVSESAPNSVFVCELWMSKDAHAASLTDASVRASIETARAWLSGEFGGDEFDVVGSPLRD